ncbi:MAG: DNA adenine methylase [Spirobacillus cienkowskii]|jgi:DNA adenine methylase|uniref:site-specific DNA-methyltransferase (adenine-specific) n=1 Tax=Spirobacillus cienkowskii TaxID=495820 RepID=A0A369KUW0_9BACT|nr:MAG: DNA adenine methylase [Spirobacillus cienkowskii]
MNPAFTYYGGKCRMSKKILKIIPNHVTYVEPFCGSAAVLFKKKLIQSGIYQEVINDSNEYLINFYRQLRDNSNQLIDKLEKTLYSKSEHDLAKKIAINLNNYSDVEKAWSFYVNIQQSYASSLNKVWDLRRVLANKGRRWSDKIINLNEIYSRLSSISIDCEDALKCIKKWDDFGVFFYVDPPYLNTDCGHYNGYTVEQFKELVYTLEHCKASFILSSYENEYLPKKWKKEFHEIKITFSNKITNKSRIEVLSIVDRSKYIKDITVKENAKKFGEIIRSI